MIARNIAPLTRQFSGESRILILVGPRQSGKTSLCRQVFRGLPYSSLDTPANLDFARMDPVGFLTQSKEGMVIDDLHREPGLLTHLLEIVEGGRHPGTFVVVSPHLIRSLVTFPSNTTSILRILPLSRRELSSAGMDPGTLHETLFQGGYPPIFDQPLDPLAWLDAYITNYLERDVRQMVNVRDLSAFRLFVRLCAGHTGQILNMTRIGADVGVDQKTIHAWLQVLEDSFVIRLLHPHPRNFGKRIVKTPKLYFYDTALAARLAGIGTAEQILTHPLRGPLFENWVIAELLKERDARGLPDNLYFWQNHTGLQMDILADREGELLPIVIKSGATLASDWFGNIQEFQKIAKGQAGTPFLVYGGNQEETRSGTCVLPWNRIMEIGVWV